MADPKYDKLYGIARDQPDVYETNDLPEADQPGEIYEEKSEAVERLHISASEAYSKFQGKEVDSKGVDFSDHIGRKHNGYNVRPNLELAAFGEKETPLQKYNRLKLEIGSLVEEVSNYSKKTNEDLATVPNELGVSVESSKQLFTQLAELRLEDKIGLDLTKSLEEQKGQQFTEVLHHINKLAKEVGEKASVSNEPRKIEIIDKNSIQLNLNLSPNQRIQLTSRITDLEQKLGQLESLVGANSNQTIRFCNVDPNDGLVNCCQWMIAKLSLLDSSQLDAIENKLSSVNARLEQCLNAQNSLSQDPEREKKINELYELCEQSRGQSELIPNLIERMIAIESMHRQSKESLQMISHLENVQSELSSSLAQNKTMMKNVKEILNSNVALIKGNTESLKDRVDRLMSGKK